MRKWKLNPQYIIKIRIQFITLSSVSVKSLCCYNVTDAQMYEILGTITPPNDLKWTVRSCINQL